MPVLKIYEKAKGNRLGVVAQQNFLKSIFRQTSFSINSTFLVAGQIFLLLFTSTSLLIFLTHTMSSLHSSELQIRPFTTDSLSFLTHSDLASRFFFSVLFPNQLHLPTKVYRLYMSIKTKEETCVGLGPSLPILSNHLNLVQSFYQFIISVSSQVEGEFSFFLFFFLKTAPTAYESSWARD